MEISDGIGAGHVRYTFHAMGAAEREIINFLKYQAHSHTIRGDIDLENRILCARQQQVAANRKTGSCYIITHYVLFSEPYFYCFPNAAVHTRIIITDVKYI